MTGPIHNVRPALPRDAFIDQLRVRAEQRARPRFDVNATVTVEDCTFAICFTMKQLEDMATRNPGIIGLPCKNCDLPIALWDFGWYILDKEDNSLDPCVIICKACFKYSLSNPQFDFEEDTEIAPQTLTTGLPNWDEGISNGEPYGIYDEDLEKIARQMDEVLALQKDFRNTRLVDFRMPPPSPPAPIKTLPPAPGAQHLARPRIEEELDSGTSATGGSKDFEVRHQIGTGDLSDALTSREQRAGIGEGGGAECLGRLQPTHGMLRAAGVRAELVRLSRTPPPDRRARHARFLVRFAHPRCITPSTHQRSSPLLRVAGFSSLSVRRTAARAFTPRVYIIDPARILGGHVNPEQALAVASPRVKTCASTSPSGSSSLKSFALVCTLGSDASTWPESAAHAYTAVAYSIAATPPLSSKECVERPDLNADKTIFAEDGWFRTGDVGQWNADGTLTLIDRCVRGATIGERAIECGLCGCRLVVGARRWESGGAPAGKYAERTETGIRATAERVKGYSGIPPGLDNHVIYLLFAQD
ncbi:hypothetical protein K438DRAFT_1972301 [Mycena galopus ATCC 62051]|nr:hypothetical protein K438DRAFT_1972301 [Mycena galopus ATCC 62051]